MRNDIKGWHEIGKARLNGYGNSGICFERDKVSLDDIEAVVNAKVAQKDVALDDSDTQNVALGDTLNGFQQVPDDLVIPF